MTGNGLEHFSNLYSQCQCNIKMAQVWYCTSLLFVCFLSESNSIISENSDDLLDVRLTLPEQVEKTPIVDNDKCLVQLHSSLEKLRKRQETSRVASLIDLSGYALHQALRNAPVDMYVTDIKVRAPSVGSWVQVQGCQFSRQAEMTTHLLFNDLLVTGVVRLLPADQLPDPQAHHPAEHCTMTLRLRRAGLNLKAAPDLGLPKNAGKGRGLQVRTESNFVDPHFLSVHAYGCRLDQWARDGWLEGQRSQQYNSFGGYNGRSSRAENDNSGEIRIISLGSEPELQDSYDHDIFRERILSQTTPAEKLAAVLTVKNKIAQQANSLFQVHGPFSSQHTTPAPPKPLFSSHQDNQKPPHQDYQKPPHQDYQKPLSHEYQRPSHQDYQKPSAAISTITELDHELRPVQPVRQKPFHTLVAQTTPLPKLPLFAAPPLHDVSSEMEDVFLRGAKALLAKYLEKQLEVPLKEALMTKIGYTVSYG